MFEVKNQKNNIALYQMPMLHQITHIWINLGLYFLSFNIFTLGFGKLLLEGLQATLKSILQ